MDSKAKPRFIDYDPDEEAENKKLSDAVNASFSSYIISLDTSKYTKAKFDGKNIDFMFEIIKHYVGFMFATIRRTASLMKIPVKILDENIAKVVSMLKRRGIFLTPVASGEEDKITPKLLIQDGHNFIKDLLQKTMNMAPSIDAELIAKRDEVLKDLEEEKKSFANTKAKANAEAASLLAEEKANRNKKLSKKQKKKPSAGAPNAAAAEYNSRKSVSAPNAAVNLARMAKEVAAEYNAEAKEAAAARNAEAKEAAARNAEAAAARNAGAKEAGAGAESSAPGAGPAAVPAIQHAFHWIMSQIHNAVYSDATIKIFLARGFKPGDVGTHELLTQNIIRLYFHGGNSVSWYKYVKEGSAGSIPYDSDFDMICLINPDLVHFAQIRKYFFELIIKTIKTIMDTPDWKESIKAYYASDKYAETIQIKLLPYKGEKTRDDVDLFDEGFTSLISSIHFEPSPLNIQIIPNIVYKDGEISNQLGVASVKMTTSMFRYGIRPIEMFEVTCPSTQYKHLKTLWEFMDLTLAEIDGYTFYVPKPVSLYLEQRIAYEGTPNSLSDKKTRRLRRSNNMKRLIRRNYNTGNANIKFELNAVVGDYEEPIRSYINEIKA